MKELELLEALAKLVGTSAEDVLAGLRQFVTDKEQEALA